MSADAGHLVAPRPQLHGAALDADGGPRRQFGQPLGGRPGERLLALRAVGVELLAKVAAPVDEGDRDHVQAAVGRGTDGVAGEDAEPARVGRNAGHQADLHREVGDRGREVHAGQRSGSGAGRAEVGQGAIMPCGQWRWEQTLARVAAARAVTPHTPSDATIKTGYSPPIFACYFAISSLVKIRHFEEAAAQARGIRTMLCADSCT